jgi:molybdopterin-binding protein
MSMHTARAAAKRLGVGYSTLKHWIHLGEVRTTQTSGGHHRIAESEIERLLARRPAHPRTAGTGAASPQPRAAGMIVAISGRNRLRAFVDEVRVDGLMAQVRLRIGDQYLTAVITRDAVEELKLRRGDDALAIIKSTEVMVAREVESDRPVGSRRARREK